ncbi:MAG: hypothetical protein ACQETB_01605 [Halobacteriota archaeon]
MHWKPIVATAVSGLAAFLVVGIAVTAYAERWIEFSVFVGLPAGIFAGAIVAAGVWFGLVGDESAARQRVTGAIVGFAVGFLAALAVAASLLGVPMTLSTIGAAIVGLLVAVGTYAFGGGGDDPDFTAAE